MAIPIGELKRWLNTLEDTDAIGIDEGGLTLLSVDDPDAYLEIGGMPEGNEGD